MAKETDEDVFPEDMLRAYLTNILGDGVELKIKKRKKRSEKLTLCFREGGDFSFAAHSTKAGASRQGMVRVLSDMRGNLVKIIRKISSGEPIQ